MAVPKPRLDDLSGDARDELLRRSRDLWRIVCGSLAVIETVGPHYEALADFAPELCAFAHAISDGRENFGEELGAAHARSQAAEGADDRYDRDVEAAIALCGGDERATIKSLLVLTEFLELEAFGEAGVRYRRER